VAENGSGLDGQLSVLGATSQFLVVVHPLKAKL
jgi:hypothetical protein